MVAHGYAESHSGHIGWLKFKEVVEEKSNGKMKVQIFPNAQMGADRELTEAVQLGNIQFGCSATAPMAAFDSDFYVFDLPFLFDGREQAFKVLDGEIGNMLLGGLSDHKLHGFGYFDNGFRNLTTSKIAVACPDDLKGLKIRTMQNQVHIKIWKFLGANPTPVSFGELIPALQQKTVDGQENPFELIYSNKISEVQSYATKTEHIYSPQVVFCNNDFWNSISSGEQDIINEAIKAGVAEQRKLAENNEKKAIEGIEKTTKITYLTPEAKAAF